MQKDKAMKKWESRLPKNCEVCRKPFGKYFFDAKTTFGPWALICEVCHSKYGVGTGIGAGQKFITKTKVGVEGFGETD